MNKKYVENALIAIGYSKHSVKHYLERKSAGIPPSEKLFELEDKYGIPVEAWRDIKSWLSNAKSMPDNCVHDQVESTKKSHQKESA